MKDKKWSVSQERRRWQRAFSLIDKEPLRFSK